MKSNCAVGVQKSINGVVLRLALPQYGHSLQINTATSEFQNARRM